MKVRSGDRGELLVGSEVAEAAVEGELARLDPEPGELGDGLRQELVLVRAAGKRGRAAAEGRAGPAWSRR
jgi:hypothetical protein